MARIGDIVHKFLITMDAGGDISLQDTDGFNNWGRIRKTFRTIDDAVWYASRCDAFKRGNMAAERDL